jgi:RNA polymerase sigma factor (sigma-70 family)
VFGKAIMQTTRVSLLLRIRDHRDSVAWAEFDAIYRPLLHRFARARGLDTDQAEDVVQHCMAAISKHITSFEYDPKRGRFKSWLSVLVTNRVRNLARGKHEQQADTRELRRPQDREDRPDEVFDKLWMQAHLRYCLQQVACEFSQRDFQAYIHYVIEEQSSEAVCQALKITPNQLYKLKQRITEKLGEHMKSLLDGADWGADVKQHFR